jgi:hypothetical protein
MTINILEVIKSQIASKVSGEIGKRLGESDSATAAGVGALIPTILGGLLSKAMAPGGASKLDESLSKGGFDGGILDNLGGMFSNDEQSSSMTSKGNDVIAMVFGDKAALLGPIIAKLTGMKSTSVLSMLAMLAPLVMSFLGKQKKTMGLDANGLADFLSSQKDSIAKALPDGVASAVGMGFLDPMAAIPPIAAPSSAHTGGGVDWARIVVPLVLLLGVAYGFYNYIYGGMRPQGEAGNVIIQAPADSEYDTSLAAGAGAVPPQENTEIQRPESDEGTTPTETPLDSPAPVATTPEPVEAK